MLTEVESARVPPVAGIAVVHELMDGIELASDAIVDWRGTAETLPPIVVRHELGDAAPTNMTAVLHVPPWCTFHIDARGEPASLFHAVFGEVDRLLTCDEPGRRYTVRYASSPQSAVVALQSELTAYSFALSARGVGLIAHSCAFVLPNGKGVVCPGMSGAGKTTLARLLRDHAPDVDLLTDDRAIVTLDDRLTVWGSPWPGAAHVAGGGSAPLAAVVFMRHGSAAGLAPIKTAEGFRRILNTLSMPLWEPARCGRALEIVDAIVTRAMLIEATYPPTADAVRWLARELDRMTG